MMRILVGYNGSEAAEAALDQLRNLGLPEVTQVLIFSVTELWVEPRTQQAASEIAEAARKYITEEFPEWTVYAETGAGSPAREILARAETFKPDLIVIGEPIQKVADGNIFLGQTSNTILTEAECPVRIARRSAEISRRPQRILVGFDGSLGSMNAVEAIAGKHWSIAPTVRLLAVTELGVLSSIGRAPRFQGTTSVDLTLASGWANMVAVKPLDLLRSKGIEAAIEMRVGNPKETIVKEAETWGADVIFVGPHCSGRSFERFLLGSVSAAVAARAHCSVEVVRTVNY